MSCNKYMRFFAYQKYRTYVLYANQARCDPPRAWQLRMLLLCVMYNYYCVLLCIVYYYVLCYSIVVIAYVLLCIVCYYVLYYSIIVIACVLLLCVFISCCMLLMMYCLLCVFCGGCATDARAL